MLDHSLDRLPPWLAAWRRRPQAGPGRCGERGRMECSRRANRGMARRAACRGLARFRAMSPANNSRGGADLRRHGAQSQSLRSSGYPPAQRRWRSSIRSSRLCMYNSCASSRLERLRTGLSSRLQGRLRPSGSSRRRGRPRGRRHPCAGNRQRAASHEPRWGGRSVWRRHPSGYRD